MLSRFVASALVMFVIGGFVLAGEYNGVITSITKDEVKFKAFKKGDKKGEEKTLKTKGLKITKGDDEVKLDDLIKMIDEAKEGKGKVKGVRAKLTTDGEDDKEVVTKIAVSTAKKKKTTDK